MSVYVLAAAEAEGFVPPGTSSFWQPLIGDGAFAITRSMIVVMLSVAIIGGLLMLMTRNLSVVPSKGQFVLESAYGLVRDSVGRDMIGEKEFRPFIPLLFTQFVLIYVNNVFGILPPVQFPTFSRVGFPIALTLIVFGLYHYLGMRRHGVVGYFKRMVPPGLPFYVVPLIFVLELVTYFISRPLSLALRLFANMFAGHMLLLVFFLGGYYMMFEADGVLLNVASVGAFAMGIGFTLFEVLIQFLQAYVFVLLTAFYISDSIAEHH